MRVVLSIAAATTVTAAALAGCSSGDDVPSDAPDIVVTSTILGDVVENLVGDTAHVEVLMPRGADPHEFQASTRQAEDMADADLLVINGQGFEGGLDDAIDAAVHGGVDLYTFTDHVQLRQLDGGYDPHIWNNPDNITANIDPLADVLVRLGLDAKTIGRQAARYKLQVGRLATELQSDLADIPADQRKLVTNHESLGYFADRFDFEIIGAVIPSLTTGAESSASDVDALAQTIDDAGVPAIFADTSSSTDLADALAEAAGHDIQVVSLYTESLGDDDSGAGTYIDMMKTDVRLIHDALTPDR